MKQSIDLKTWPRASAFKHFVQYSDPYFGITTHIDCTEAYVRAKELGVSFFLYYFYLSLQAANEIPEFRCRIKDGKPVIYDTVNGSPTIMRDDGELGYAMLEYNTAFKTFLINAEKEIERVRAYPDLDTSKDCPETIYYSIMPWITFTSVKHPLDLPTTEGIPILTFGKMTEENGKKTMPLAVHAHHALMDGKHIAKFVESFQKKLSE
ncbi:MAG: chloramphenicol acetyltransferase [Candidatus Marinimicrobia bacterium]|nr:chloramphenicol acetyltransferase [Candidatus Neomarinimicrobiota bacterium]